MTRRSVGQVARRSPPGPVRRIGGQVRHLRLGIGDTVGVEGLAPVALA